MKMESLHFKRHTFYIAFVAILGCVSLIFSATTVSAQAPGATLAVSAPISTEDLPGWKNPADYAAVITAEKASTAATLATPNQKVAQVALYTGYDHMLTYMQADLNAGAPIEEIALNNFKKVVLESATDPSLQPMQQDDLTALYEALVVKLTKQ